MNHLNEVPVGLLILCAVLGILVAALLSAGESALLSATRTAIGDISARKPHKAARLEFLSENAISVASLASFGRVSAEMFASACITVALTTVFNRWWTVVLVSAAVSILVALVLVRISPRTLGRLSSAKVLDALSGLLMFVYSTLRWIIPITKEAHITKAMTEEHALRDFVYRVEDSNVIEDEEREMMRSIMGLHETRVSEVMVPRPDMIAIQASAPLSKATNLFVRSGFSRVPVIGESADEVHGVLFFKDTARVLLNAQDPESKTVADVMRPVHFYPEMKPADDLLREMQATHQHIAMAVDEYGGVAGLVTVEDILEEIVGELVDEHDVETPAVDELGPNKYRVPARMALDDLGELFDLELDDPDVDTVGGLLAKHLGRIPLAGAEIVVDGLRIRPDQFTGRRKQLSAVIVEKQHTEISDDSETSEEVASLPAGQDPSDQRGSGHAEQE